MLHLKQRHQLTIQKHEPAQMQLFQLIPVGIDCKMPAVEIDFSPVHGISQLPQIKSDPYFLPCLFVSPIQKAQLENNEQKLGDSTQEILTETFQAKVSQATEQACALKKVLFKPKPSSNYCQICKQKFPDYEQHVNHEIHQKKKNQNEFTRHIERLVFNFQANEQNRFKRSKPVCEKLEKKTNSYIFLQRPTKKIVINRQECKTVSMTKIDSLMSDKRIV